MTLESFDDLEALSRGAARAIETATARKPCSLVLSGGSTPRRLFELLGTEWRDRLPWSDIHLFWSDERFVPADHEASNYGTAADLFIDRVDVPPEHVHRVPTESQNLEEAADAYDRDIRRYFTDRNEVAFDLALLGLGEDGHSASLFPGHESAAGRWAEAVVGPEYRPPRERVTMTYDALRAARVVLFLASGAAKREVVARLAGGRGGGRAGEMPAGRIRGTERTAILADAAAAR